MHCILKIKTLSCPTRLKIILQNFPHSEGHHTRPGDPFTFSNGITFLLNKTHSGWILDLISQLFVQEQQIITNANVFTIRITTLFEQPGVLLTVHNRLDSIVYAKAITEEVFELSITIKLIAGHLLLPSEI